jgi:hypothetical protein
MNEFASRILDALHLASVAPYASAAVMSCAAIDATIPQPKPGSHWLPVRKVVSMVALNFGNSANASQPPLSTWLVRVLAPLIAAQAANLAKAAAVPTTGASPAPLT